jgi:hypothetical protein
MPFRPPIKASYPERQMGTSLGVAVLIASYFGLFTFRVWDDPRLWPSWILMAALVGFFVVLAVVTYRRKPAALTQTAWAYAFGWASLVALCYGTFTLVTGRAAGKLGSYPVPRSSSKIDFFIAAGSALVGYALSKWRIGTARSPQVEDDGPAMRELPEDRSAPTNRRRRSARPVPRRED